VEAVQQLSAHFQGYASIPKVAELSGRVNALQTSLQVREQGLSKGIACQDVPTPLCLSQDRSHPAGDAPPPPPTHTHPANGWKAREKQRQGLKPCHDRSARGDAGGVCGSVAGGDARGDEAACKDLRVQC